MLTRDSIARCLERYSTDSGHAVLSSGEVMERHDFAYDGSGKKRGTGTLFADHPTPSLYGTTERAWRRLGGARSISVLKSGCRSGGRVVVPLTDSGMARDLT